MALEAKNINTIEDMQRFVEGCLNDMEFGISTKEETLNNLKDYTFRVIELSENNQSELFFKFINKHYSHSPESYRKELKDSFDEYLKRF